MTLEVQEDGLRDLVDLLRWRSRYLRLLVGGWTSELSELDEQ